MHKDAYIGKRGKTPALLVLMLVLLATLLTACTTSSNPDTTPSTIGDGNSDTNTSNVALGPQACPTAVSTTTYWEPIVPTQAEVNKVQSVTCAHLKGNSSLQAVVLVRVDGTGGYLDIHVYDNITNPTPTQIFLLQGLGKGVAKLSPYNTLLTGEINFDSTYNAAQTANIGYVVDLYREFKWSGSAGTLVPVAFPGFYPYMTRYQAELGQEEVNKGADAWHLDASEVTKRFVTDAKLLKWSAPQIAVVSGGKVGDAQAVIKAKDSQDGGGTITVTLDRLEGNTKNGIWIITKTASDGLTLTTPKNLDRINSPFTATGKGNAFEGIIGDVKVLDSVYAPIGTAQAKATGEGNGNRPFSTNVTYKSTFKTGLEEGIVVLYTYSQATGNISGTIFYKELLGYAA